MFGLFDSAEARRCKKGVKPIRGSMEPHQLGCLPGLEEFIIRVKVIDDACCQLDCIEPTIEIPAELPDAVVVDTCRIVNISTQSAIVAPGIVSLRVFFDLVITYIDGVGGYHTVMETISFPAEDLPAKMVSLAEADRDIHQTVVEVSANCSLCVVEGAGRLLRCVVFLFICVKIGRYLQLAICAQEVTEHPECEPAETTCPPLNNAPGYVRKKFGL